MADPFRNFKFVVEINGFIRAGFNKISGLKRTVDVTEYREGADNDTTRKLPGQTKYDNVTFERGQSNDSDFIDWANQIFNLDSVDGANGPAEGFRKRIVIYLKDKAGVRVKKWTLKRCWPMEDSDGDLDAGSSDVLPETMIVAHEGMTKENLGGGGGGATTGGVFDQGL